MKELLGIFAIVFAVYGLIGWGISAAIDSYQERKQQELRVLIEQVIDERAKKAETPASK